MSSKGRQKSIFTDLYLKLALILIFTNIGYIIFFTPYHSRQLTEFVSSEGRTFAKATTAALLESFYADDYTYIIDFLRNAAEKSGTVQYVAVQKTGEQTLLISPKSWKQVDWDTPRVDESAEFEKVRESTSLIDQSDVFHFYADINIAGLSWGTMVVGLEREGFDQLRSRLVSDIILLSVFVVAFALFALRMFSNRLRFEIRELESVSRRLSEGYDNIRANENSPGEIGMLGRTFNKMVDSLSSTHRDLGRIARVFSEADDGIIIFDENRMVRFVNESACYLANTKEEELLDLSFYDAITALGIASQTADELFNQLEKAPDDIVSTEIVVNTKGVEATFHLRLGQTLEENSNEISSHFLMVADISHRKRMERTLNNLAYRDKLTELPNRQSFNVMIDQMVGSSSSAEFALLFMDFDNFKLVNDTLGHETGDKLLMLAGERIQKALRKSDSLYRLGGDEFTVIIPSLTSADTMESIAQSILEKFEEPIRIDGREIHGSVSIGIAKFPQDGRTRGDLLKNADMAMYASKRSGGNCYRFFQTSMGQNLADQLTTEARLRAALKNSELEAWYQPIVDVKTGEVTSLEALVRWIQADGSIISPLQFIPIAEKTGLVVEIGKVMVQHVCQTLKDLETTGFDGTITINVSGREFIEEDYVANVIQILKLNSVDPSRIILEVTESVLIDHADENLVKLRKLKEVGFRLAIDDFGTGFSSLTYLDRFPIDILKIDKSFVSRAVNDQKAQAIVRGVTQLSHGLDLTVVGEGVETAAHLNCLRVAGCDLAQGYYFSRPVSKKTLLERLSNGQFNTGADKTPPMREHVAA